MLVEEIDAVLLTGGSAFGLAAADGVVRWLEEKGIGFDTGVVPVPIVPAAAIFDLTVGDPARRPGPDEGYAACERASEEVPEGPVGAGSGATVAKLHGPHRAAPGGLGSASVGDDDVTVGALAVVNAIGEIVKDDGELLVGALPEAEIPGETLPPPGTSTTLGVIATNARLTKSEAFSLAGAGHDGLARAVRPAHTMWDGDTVFTLATGEVAAPLALVERLAAEAMAEAIRRAVNRGVRGRSSP
jgi:L-aminopeptidase/D-esterase-like protein